RSFSSKEGWPDWKASNEGHPVTNPKFELYAEKKNSKWLVSPHKEYADTVSHIKPIKCEKIKSILKKGIIPRYIQTCLYASAIRYIKLPDSPHNKLYKPLR